MNSFEILDVRPGDTETDLAKAYRRKMFDAHPDRGGDHEKAKMISKAYETLKQGLVDDGSGVKRLISPHHSIPRRSMRVIIVQQGPGVSADFTRTGAW